MATATPITLTQYGMMAEKHWREFLPNMVRELERNYTSPAVIQGMYAALYRLGFDSGRILEPACGIGHFIGAMPDAMHARSYVTGI